MQIEIRNRRGKSPRAFTHAVYVDDVAVGFGWERSLESVCESLKKDQRYALELKEEFRNEPEEW